MFKRIDHIEIVPQNPDATIRFYTDVLGFRVTSRIPVKAPRLRDVTYLQLGETGIEIPSVDRPAAKSQTPWQVGYRTLALEVEDMARAVAYLEKRGVTISRPPVNLGDSFRAEIEDPDGLSIELREWKKSKA